MIDNYGRDDFRVFNLSISIKVRHVRIRIDLMMAVYRMCGLNSIDPHPFRNIVIRSSRYDGPSFRTTTTINRPLLQYTLGPSIRRFVVQYVSCPTPIS